MSPRVSTTWNQHSFMTVASTGASPSGGARKATSGLKECQQIGVELVFVRVREAVRCARVDL